MGIVIALPSRREIRLPDLALDEGGFTRRDLADLQDWSTAGRRAVDCTSDAGIFAMLYQADHCWASWGVTRHANGIQLWNCVTHRDIGVFPTMAAALAGISGRSVSAGEIPFSTAAGFPNPTEDALSRA